MRPALRVRVYSSLVGPARRAVSVHKDQTLCTMHTTDSQSDPGNPRSRENDHIDPEVYKA